MAAKNTNTDTDKSRTPAFHRLQIHESDVKTRLRSGFATADELLIWLLDVSRFTLGYIDDEFPRRLLTDRYRLSRLVERIGKHDMSEMPGSSNVTERIIERQLTPGFQSARGFIRTKASDRDEGIDASKQRFTALIPRVDTVAQAQLKAVEWALGIDGQTDHGGPVRSRSDISDWISQVDFATTAFVPEPVFDEVRTLGTTWRYQLVDGRGMQLRVLIGRDLLPYMNRAINDAAKAGMEQDERERVRAQEASIS